MFTDKKTQAVAEAVRKVMEADLSAKQKKIAAVAGDPKKIDAKDFKKLRGEEVEQIDELSVHKMLKYTDAANKNREVLNKKWDTGTATEKEKNKVLGHEMGVDRAAARVKAKTGKNPNEIGKLSRMKYAVTKEESEQIDEAPMKSGAQSRREVDSVMDKYGFGSKQKEAPKSNTRAVAGKSYGANYDDPEGNDDADDKKPEAGPKKSVKKGVFKRRYNTKAYTKESFTGLLNDYMDGGVKSLLESLEIVEVEEEGVAENIEQMDEDEMTQRKKEQVVTVKHKDSGKELRVVKAAVADYQKRGYHPVKEEVEQIDERHLTDDETATKEHNVKSMKKNLSGFKERYGKDAKSVMYATATKQAKED